MYTLLKTTKRINPGSQLEPAPAKAGDGTSFTTHWTLKKILSNKPKKPNHKGETMTNHTLNARPNTLLKNQSTVSKMNTNYTGAFMSPLNLTHTKNHKNILQKYKINDTMMEPFNHGEQTSMIKPVFRKPTAADEALIKSWWATSHVMAFWGNDPSKHFPKLEYVLHGGTNPHNYETEYWLACDGDVPYGLLLTSDMRDGIMADAIHAAYFAHGPTWSVDMLIGPESYLGRGYAIPTLRAFVQYLQTKGVARLMIDPEVTNVKATHVYERAGFKTVTTFQPKEGQFAAGRDHYLMVLDLIS